ncbi:hypothetical protein PACILC2_02120 [Paenibacillus cisolokensis]|uniref:Major facilitator superfamily (MFS) profile domain-containing protein n=1 Tax=Paenibacillus cisolokensis TaxID=1658519 RepID=A0ABQ4N0E6_9BACL|nr:hypothetical protein [Paenibacillus cisolokensis]GIQ61644.1 hypothetical protein PACILC2_02120 [Paenibacillus cisolokensis]
MPMLYGFSESYPVVLIGSGIQGIGDAIWDIGIMAYVFRLAPGREATVFGLHLLLFGIRGTIGPLLSTGLSETLPFSIMLFAASICGWVGVVIFLLPMIRSRFPIRPQSSVNIRRNHSDS